MKGWIIEPRDTLVLRDGAPADGVMRTLGFPWPSSTTGVMRSRAGLGPDGAFDQRRREEVLAFDVAGPLLARLDNGGDVDELYVPAPRDCVWHHAEDEGAVGTDPLACALSPTRGAGWSTPSGSSGTGSLRWLRRHTCG